MKCFVLTVHDRQGFPQGCGVAGQAQKIASTPLQQLRVSRGIPGCKSPEEEEEEESITECQL